MSTLVGALLNGILTAVPIFLVASGLTIVYGTMRVLNFAHGALFMVGAFLLSQFLGAKAVSWYAFLLAALLCGLCVAVLAAVIEVGVFRRLYAKPHIVGLLASFAILFAAQGAAQLIWGLVPLSQQPPRGVTGPVHLLGTVISRYSIAEAVVGAVVAVGLWLLLKRSRLGRLLRAVADDREMAEALGIRADRMGLTAFALSGFLAGIAGSLLAPVSSIDISLAQTYLILSFAVIILGRPGSLRGALLAALGLGVFNSLLSSYVPDLLAFGTYIGLAAGLLIRRREAITA
ncbi:branched-chain amino acid ABC transporter permease [Actinacidiphila sp. ITFR-21]|uniref:branched-chain amino acid ABC transporter permease n=1 Tax=Actinacidiphila sp. ITFR-21 TaxID=3075199 RepID=UPI00288932B6|nr:branched-chain amino acid ABC transporter permease [Streptomyces sp. ITFR-21]WNI19002.1 branched-chain amino acid ABC transporter permease [Streptomyces sp. ITFR-21]